MTSKMDKAELICMCLDSEELLQTRIDTGKAEKTSVGRYTRTQRAIRIIRMLVARNCADEVELDYDTEQDLMALLDPQQGGGTKVIVHIGDTLLELYQRYSEVPNFMKKLNEQLEKKGWIIDGTTGAVKEA